MSGRPSLYIHVPFCTHKCGYCHFFVLPFKEDLVKLYLKALKQEIALKEIKYPQTIYFGGGTPSLLGPLAIAEILSWIPHHEGIEITLEANPEHLIPGFLSSGINRMSLGVQSLDDHLLTELSRKHDARKAIAAIEALHEEGIRNISIDLMYDIPSQRVDSWSRTLDRVKELPIQHLSLYNLTIEPQTAFHLKKEELEKRIPLPEESLKMLEEAVRRLEHFGLKRYEISAFAKQGFASQHNSGYWTGREFHGLGPSAFSYLNGTRARNVAHLKKYATSLDSGASPIDFEETLSFEAKTRELLAIGLRMIEGVTKPDLIPEIEELIKNDFLEIRKDKLVLTSKGLLFYDHVATCLI